jgi:beta-glucosidase
VFIGYRHYDRQGITPMFPFGFGLSYTSFELFDLAIDDSKFESDGAVSVYVTVANIGTRAGSEVVQLYVGDEASSVPRPAKELKAFAKLYLAPGETRRLRLELKERDFAFYSVEAKHWLVEPGAFSLLVGTSATDIKLSGQVRRNNRVLIPV